MGLIELVTELGELLRPLGIVVWIAIFGALAAALKLPKTWPGKTVAVLVVVGLAVAFPGRWGWEVKQRRDHHKRAWAMFQERCKKAGVFIHRTAEDVEGIYLLKLRPKGLNRDKQYLMDDPYGKDLRGGGYIESFLRKRDEKGVFNVVAVGGYRYVDAIDPKDGLRYRYTGRMDEPWKRNPHALEGHRVFVLDKVPAPDPAPRYGVTYDDISTREERDYWIAGSSLRVIDLETNEVMAERIGYMVDAGQGNNSGGRAPWLFAARNACPTFGGSQTHQTRNFVEKVLKPKMEK